MVNEERKISRRDFLRFTKSAASGALVLALQALLPEGSRADEEKPQKLKQHSKEIPHFDKILCLPPDPDLLLPERKANPLFQKLRSSGEKKLFWRPPETKEYLKGFPLSVSDQRTDGTTFDRDNTLLFYHGRPDGCLTAINIKQPEINQWTVPSPKLKEHQFMFIPVMSSPVSLGGEKSVYASLIADYEKRSFIPVYTIADFVGHSVFFIEASQLYWKPPVAINNGRTIIAVGNQYNASFPLSSPGGAGIEFIDTQNGQRKILNLGKNEYLRDGAGFQVGDRIHPELLETQVGMPLAGHYVIFDREGKRIDLKHLAGIERAILADLDGDGCHEIIGAKAGGMVMIGSAKSDRVYEFPLLQPGDRDQSWRVTSLAAFRNNSGKVFVFVTGATNYFNQTRLMLIEAEGKSEIHSKIIKSKGLDFPVGYGLAGDIVDERRIFLASPGYEKSTNQRRLTVFLYDDSVGQAEQLGIYRFGTWDEGVVSLGRPTVTRLGNSLGVFSQLNLTSSDTWIIGLEKRLASCSLLSKQPEQPEEAVGWSHSVGGDQRYTQALPLYGNKKKF